MENFKLLGKIGEGAHGTVWKVRNRNNGEINALKRVQVKNFREGIPVNALREIKTLQITDNKYVVQLLEVFTDGPGFALVFEYLVSDLSSVLHKAKRPLDEAVAKSYMIMLLKGIDHCHKLNIMHRDLKPANLLISSNGILKIADFGLATLFWSDDDSRVYSHQVATRWYRAPELLYGAKNYDTGVDLWAVGCIFGEILNNSPVFPGENDIEQLCLVLKTLGTPTEETWPGLKQLPDYNKIMFPDSPGIPYSDLFPHASSLAIELIKSLLLYSSRQRISAEKALANKYFFLHPLPCPEHNLPQPSIKQHRDLVFNEIDCSRPLELSLVSTKDLEPFVHLWSK